VTEAEILARGREVLRTEARSVEALAGRLDRHFTEAVRAIRETEGRVIVSGVGKSGIVARKVASTLASTGTPAHFLHPTEAVHGDLGLVVPGDLLLGISRSGETEDLIELVLAARRLEVPVVLVTGEPRSRLADRAEIVLDASVRKEACPMDLAPTASSTAALALGDAMAMAVLELRGFDAGDFARRHPRGALGRRLLWRVEDVMLKSEDGVPELTPESSLREAMHEIAFRRGTVPILADGRRVVGVVTAGDLTRFADERPDFLTRPVREAMSGDPRVVRREAPAVEAVAEMEEHGIMAMPVVDGERRLLGMVHLHDLLRAGIR